LDHRLSKLPPSANLKLSRDPTSHQISTPNPSSNA
jgi:hypothetical protein